MNQKGGTVSDSMQNDNIIAGIRENDLGSLSLEIMGCVDRISVIFNRIDSTVNSIPAQYRGESCDELMRSYAKLKAEFPLVKENVKSYADDLVSLLNKMKQIDFDLTKLFRNADDEARKQINQLDTINNTNNNLNKI